MSKTETMNRFRRVLAAFLAAALVMPGGLLTPPPARAQAQGSFGGFLELSSVFFGDGDRTFGAGEAIAVSGAVPFVPRAACFSTLPVLAGGLGASGRGELQQGFADPFPTADLFVIADTGQVMPALTKLNDVSPAVNRVIGLSSGAFIDEPVAFNLPAGRYDIVMDQCLDGYLDPFVDIVLGEGPSYAFEVVIPGPLPPINLHPLKQNAALYGEGLGHQAISGACRAFDKLSKNQKVTANINSSLVVLMNIMVIKCADLSTHWKAIAKDPPDPNFTQFAELGPLDYNFAPVNTPLERAARTLAHALSEQAAASKALLTSLERFQGAQQAANDEYMILQLEETNKFINLLMGPGGSMLRTYAALEAFDIALRDDPLGSEQDAQDLRAAIPGLRRGIGGLLGPLTSTFIRVKSGGVDVVVPSGLQGWIIVYLGRDPFLPGLGLPGIPQLRAANGLPPIVFQHPTASSTGPYIAPPGKNVPFDAGTSTDPNGGALTYSWDFDGDGNFNDSSASSAPLPFAEPGTRLAGLKVTDSSGNSDVLYVLVKIGDINTQDVFGYQRSSADLQHITPNGTVNLLSPGLGPISDLTRALHVDFGGDIFVLDETMLRHFDSAGNHIKTLSLQQVGNLLGFPVQRFTEFVIDGRGDLIVSLVEDLGPGCVLIPGIRLTCIPQVPGLMKLVRLARDGSRASVLTDIHQYYLTKQIINGQLILEISGGSLNDTGGDIALSKDPQGNVVVASANNLFPLTSGSGIWQVDPNTGAVTNVMPSGLWPFVIYRPSFGGVQIQGIHHIGTYRGTGGIEVDSRGDYILGNSAHAIGLKLARMFVPPQINTTTNLVEVFPAYLTTSGVTNVAEWPDFVIDRGGDYLMGGGDFFAGPQTFGLYRVTPISEIFKVANIATPPHYLDVVPEVREVTPKDLPPPPQVRLENLTINQQSCPGGAEAGITVNNPGTADLTEPLRVYFFDGDPTAGGVVFGSAIAPSIAAGASVNLTAPWPNPGPGVHQVFAMALGATNMAFKAFMVCVPTLPAGSDGLELFPASATTSLGSSHTLTAELKGLFGAPISGAPIQFTVTGANTASGTATTDANGVATFTYSGTNPGLDTAVATFAGGSSGPATNDWTGAPADTTPPVLSLPANMTVEATSPAGAVVSYSASANDAVDGAITPVCSPASGATFALGTTTVNCSAVDLSNNSSSGSFSVTVQDTTPPTLAPHANMSVAATAPNGAAVNYSPPAATDAVDSAPAANCTPASGSLFPIGTTTVNCTATDFSGNQATSFFDVFVQVGTPRIAGTLVGRGSDALGNRYFEVRLTNTGTGHARNLKITQLLLRTLAGSGTVTYLPALSGALPLAIGNLDVGTSSTIRLYLNVPATVTRFSITESGTVQNVAGTQFTYSTAQSVIP